MCLYAVILAYVVICGMICGFFFFQAEDGIRDAQESRGLGDVYKRQVHAEQAVVFKDGEITGDVALPGGVGGQGDVAGHGLSLIHI